MIIKTLYITVLSENRCKYIYADKPPKPIENHNPDKVKLSRFLWKEELFKIFSKDYVSMHMFFRCQDIQVSVDGNNTWFKLNK